MEGSVKDRYLWSSSQIVGGRKPGSKIGIIIHRGAFRDTTSAQDVTTLDSSQADNI